MGWEAAVVGVGAAIGGIMGALTSLAAASAKYAQAEYQHKLAARNSRQEQIYANLARNQAAAAAQATEFETQAATNQLRRKHSIEMSENRSLLGKSGLQNSGSNLLFNIDNAITAAVDEQNVLISGRYKADLQRYEGEINAYKHEVQSGNYKMQSDYYSDVGDAAEAEMWWGTIMGGISGALNGAQGGANLADSVNKLNGGGGGLNFGGLNLGGSGTGTSLFGIMRMSAGA